MPSQKVNGADIYYEEAGSGEPLVMVYGSIDGSAQIFTPHLADLSKDFRVILPDLRGLGRSTHATDFAPSQWVDDLRGLLDALHIPAAHLYGGAMGSRPVLRLAVEYPERVKTLILDWPIIFSEPATDTGGGQAFGANVPPERAKAFQDHHGSDWAAVSEFYAKFRSSDAFKRYYDLREPSKRVKAPTLIIRGDTNAPPQAELHPLAHAVLAHEHIANSWLAIYPTFRGNLARQRPEEFRALLRRFVAAQQTAKAAG